MTYHFDSLLTVNDTTISSWGLFREAGTYWVSVGMAPFNAQFKAVVDDFGTLVPVRRY